MARFMFNKMNGIILLKIILVDKRVWFSIPVHV